MSKKEKIKDMPKYISVPMTYTISEYSADPRYQSIRIRVAHTGLNLNASSISKEAFENAKDTIINIPILAFIKSVDGSNEKTFGGHEQELVINEDGISIRYLGRPIGLIPESGNDYHYEIVDDEEFIVVRGIIWKDYSTEALSILEKEKVVEQSMEIMINDYDFDDDTDTFIIKSFAYTGLCLLGGDSKAAMGKNCIAELLFSQNKFSTDEYSKMIEESKLLTSEKLEIPEYSMSLFNYMPVINYEYGSVDDEVLTKEYETWMTSKNDDSLQDNKENIIENQSDIISKLFDHIAKMETDINSLTKQLEDSIIENQDLKEFKMEKIQEEKREMEEEILQKFADKLDEEEIDNLRKMCEEGKMPIQDLENNCYILAAKKIIKFDNNSKKNKNKSKDLVVDVVSKVKVEETNYYGYLDEKIKA